MSDIKSKLPSLSELASMSGKLFKDMKKSVSEIIKDYKSKHPNEEVTENKPEAASAEEKPAKKRAPASKKKAD